MSSKRVQEKTDNDFMYNNIFSLILNVT